MNRRTWLKGTAASVAAAAARPSFAADLLQDAAPPLARTSYGPVSGYRTAKAIGFKGIPYGADTFTTRFQAPRSPGKWSSPLACTSWAPRAPQQSPDRARPVPNAAAAVNAGFAALEGAETHYHLPPDEGTQSEDCLHLNLWTPALRDGKLRPVLFYIHGGAYNNGTVNAELYDGTRLAERGDVVVVTINHRLNAFGYLYLAELPGLESYTQSGNAGQLDLVLALEWVRDNIAEFGGDPDSVTIFGQSGGGAKCATLMAMPAAVGLFHRVLTMSGQQVWAAPPRVSTNRAGAALTAMGLGADQTLTPEMLKSLTMQQIQMGARTTPNWLPVKDDVVLSRDPFSPDAPKMSDAVPMMLGNTKDEIMGSTAWQHAGLTWETLPDDLGKAIQPFRGPYTVEEIIKAYRGWYPAYTPVDVYVASIAAFRSWPGQVIEAERRAANPIACTRTWVYQMDFGVPTADNRAPHTVDLAFMFDNLELSPGMVGATDKDIADAQPLATMMSNMLVQFARTGNPNGTGSKPKAGGMPVWPTYDLKDRNTMLFERTSKVVSDPRGDERRMMVGAHYRQPGT